MNAPMKDQEDIRHCGKPVGREPFASKNLSPVDLIYSSIKIRYDVVCGTETDRKNYFGFI
jgi:hypothetical protein